MNLPLAAALLVAALVPQDAAARKRAEELVKKFGSAPDLERARLGEVLLSLGEEAEAAIRKAAEGGAAPVRERYDALLKELDVRRKFADHWVPARPITVTFRGAPLKEAVDHLNKVSGAKIDLGAVNPATRVNLAAENAFLLEVLDGLCRRNGFWFEREGPTFKLLQSPPPPEVSAFAGPSRLSGLLTKGPDGKLYLLFYHHWEPTARPLRYDVEVDSAFDDNRKPVATKAGSQVTGGNRFSIAIDTRGEEPIPPDTEMEPSFASGFELDPLSKGATRLATVKGRVTVFFAQDRHLLRFEKPAKDQESAAGPFPARLKSFEYSDKLAGWEACIELDQRAAPAEKRQTLHQMQIKYRMRFTDDQGKVHAGKQSGFGVGKVGGPELFNWSRMYGFSRNFPRDTAPSAVEFDVITDYWTKTFPFEAKNVTLKP